MGDIGGRDTQIMGKAPGKSVSRRSRFESCREPVTSTLVIPPASNVSSILAAPGITATLGISLK